MRFPDQVSRRNPDRRTENEQDLKGSGTNKKLVTQFQLVLISFNREVQQQKWIAAALPAEYHTSGVLMYNFGSKPTWQVHISIQPRGYCLEFAPDYKCGVVPRVIYQDSTHYKEETDNYEY
jgi:hypothetical protein